MLGFAMLREASWSRSKSSWGMSQFKRPNATLGANSGFDQRSMIALASSRILELGARCGRVADHSPGISVSLQAEHKQFIGNGHLIGSSLS